MANITLAKQGKYIVIDFGSFYPADVLEAYHDFPTEDYGGVRKLRVIVGESYEEGLEFHIRHETEPIMLTHESGLTNFYKVDSVNGTVPIDLEHLRLLIRELR